MKIKRFSNASKYVWAYFLEVKTMKKMYFKFSKPNLQRRKERFFYCDFILWRYFIRKNNLNKLLFCFRFPVLEEELQAAEDKFDESKNLSYNSMMNFIESDVSID